MKEEILKKLNWKEKIIVKIFAKTVDKICNMYRIEIVNILINE